MGVSRESWNDAYRNGLFSQELIGALSVLDLPFHCSALDLGCGAGRDAVYLAQVGYDVTGIDLAPEAIEIASQRARERGVKVAWTIGDVLDLPYKDQAFHLVTDRACFHHIPDDDRPNYVREVSRVLKPGGFLILRGSSVPDRSGAACSACEQRGRAYGKYGHSSSEVTLAPTRRFSTALMRDFSAH
ncbi:MAG: class I SAM-dependent methyltransferase [Oligoflexia bacterium]|nr:class I SAM-dependent methyltransferase [Oligoflexia bacterium]